MFSVVEEGNNPSKIVRHCAVSATREVRIPHMGIGDGKQQN